MCYSKDGFTAPVGAHIESFALEQRNRDASHYATYPSANYAARSSMAVEQLSTSVPAEVLLHIFPTEGEYEDNVVVHLVPTVGLVRGQSVTVTYRLRAY